MDPQMRFVHVQPANMASGRIVPVFREVSRLPQPKKRTRKTRYAPASNFNIRGLPRELRAIIFREDLLEWTNDKLTPPLVQALRPEFQLYQEVLDLFYFLKPCSITGRNQRSVLSIPRSVLKRVLFVDLHYGNVLRKESWTFQVAIPHRLIAILQKSRLRSLHLVTSMQDTDESTTRKIELLVREVIIKLPTLASLVVDIPIDAATWKRDRLKWTVDLISPVREIDQATGITHKWTKSKGQFAIGVRWDAKMYETLTWTSEEYWRSIRRENLGLVYNRLTACQQFCFSKPHHPQFLGFNSRCRCFDCPNKSCRCHEMVTDGRPMSTSSAQTGVPKSEEFHVNCELLDTIAMTMVLLKKGAAT